LCGLSGYEARQAFFRQAERPVPVLERAFVFALEQFPEIMRKKEAGFSTAPLPLSTPRKISKTSLLHFSTPCAINNR
ncbi:hypothetical protein, partial [uncultured Oscillibacter sp.]|uniref:hypothetical protein n=1 Tax=uncultured Oscillibacter sp. TaxID=876091 RepID=UPI002614E547